MAKSKTALDGAVPVEGEPEAAVIIEKYLATRGDIAPEIKRVFCVIYRSETNIMSAWDEIINNRLKKPAV